MTTCPASKADEPSRDGVVVFDRRGVEFLPPFQLALQIEKLLSTIIVEGALSVRKDLHRLPLRSRVSRCPSRPGAQGRRTLYHPIVLPERHRLSWLTRPINQRRLRRELQSLTGCFERLAVIYDNCRQLPLVGTLGEATSAYYLYDNFSVDLTGRKHGSLDEAMEAEMIATVDVVFAVSHELCDYAARRAKRVHYLPNGYNADLFFPRPCRNRIASQKVVIGYSGVISGRIDYDGLMKTAIARPEWNFRLLGQVSATIEEEFEQTGRPKDLHRQLLALPNVTCLPHKPMPNVPDIIAEFDVALVPYCLNAFTMASSPLKVYEYYAMGIPVVSTRIPEVLRFDPDIPTADEGGSYVDAITRALVAGRHPEWHTRQTAIAGPHSTFARAQDAVAQLLPQTTG